MKKFIKSLVALLLFAVMTVVAARTILQVLYPQKYEDFVLQYSEEYGVDKDLIYAVMRTESSFNPEATSVVGAYGLMQIMPDTFDWLCYRMHEEGDFASLQDPQTAIRFGAYFLKLLGDEFGDVHTTLAAYHAGRGQVNKWLQNSTYSYDGKTLHTIPTPDTAHYVAKVERAMQIYKKLYNEQSQLFKQKG